MISCKECEYFDNSRCGKKDKPVEGDPTKQGCQLGKKGSYDGVEICYKERLKEVQFFYRLSNEERDQLDNFIREYIKVINETYPTYTILEVIHYVKSNYHKDLENNVEEIQNKIKYVYS